MSKKILEKLKKAGLRINADKSFFARDEVKYLGYVLSRQGIRPESKKLSAILALNPPLNVKELQGFLGMVQYYRDIWEKRPNMLAPLTDLVGECGHTKVTKKNKTKKKPWYWSEVNHTAFEEI